MSSDGQAAGGERPTNPLAASTDDALRKKQRQLRSLLSTFAKHITSSIERSLSRTAIVCHRASLKQTLSEATAISEELVDRLEEAEAPHDDLDRQRTAHLEYRDMVTEVEEDVEAYLQARADDAASVMEPPREGPPRPSDFSTPSNEALHRSRMASHNRPDAAAVAAAREKAQATATAAAAAREEFLHLVSGAAGSDEDDEGQDLDATIASGIATHAVTFNRPLTSSTPLKTLSKSKPRKVEVVAPDQWVDDYCSGAAPVCWTGRGTRSAPSNLPRFSGRSLEWFAWIDSFYALVHVTDRSPGEKLGLLRSCLPPDLCDLIYGLSGGEAAYKETLRTLKENCGRRDVMKIAHEQAVIKMEVPRDNTAFKRYAEKVRTHLFDLTRIGTSHHPDLIERIVQRLQQYDRLDWNGQRSQGSLETRTLLEFGQWLCQRASFYQNAYTLAADETRGGADKGAHTIQAGEQSSRSRNRHRGKESRSHASEAVVNAATVAAATAAGPIADGFWPPPRSSAPPFCFHCSGEHRLENCIAFKTMAVADRTSFCVRRALCFSCLGAKHSSRDCRYRRKCKEPNCQFYHHPLLHETLPLSTSAAPTVETKAHSVQSGPANSELEVVLGVIRLDAIAANGKRISVNVFFDDGSDTSFIREGCAKKLGLTGQTRSLRINGVNNAVSELTTQRVHVRLKSALGGICELDAYTLPHVRRPAPSVDWDLVRTRWPYLADLPLQNSSGPVDILIGGDHQHLIAALETRMGGPFQPVASRCALGWFVRGVVGLDVPAAAANVHLIMTDWASLTEAVKGFCATESFGTEFKGAAMSEENQRAVQQLRDGMKKLTWDSSLVARWST